MAPSISGLGPDAAPESPNIRMVGFVTLFTMIDVNDLVSHHVFRSNNILLC